MSDSIAGLSFNIDSSQTAAATQNLNELAAAADRTGDSQDRFNQHTQRFIAVAHDLSASVAELRQQYQQTSATIDASIETLNRWEQQATQSAAAFAVFDEARKHVDALGVSFGTTSTTLQLFYDRAQQLQLNSGETTIALQRITDAIQGQTQSGLAVRSQLDRLGVNPGSNTANADQVLSEVITRLRGIQDSPEKARTAQELFGTIDPDTLQSLSEPNFVSLAQRRQIQQDREVRLRTGDATRLASQLHTQNQLDTSDLDDLRFNPGLTGFGSFTGRYNLSNLSADQSDRLARQLGLPAGNLGSAGPETQLTALRYLRDNPQSDYANSAESTLSRVGDYVRTGYLGRLYRYDTSGELSANDLAIQEQGNRAYLNTGSYFGSAFRTFGRRIAAGFNPDLRLQPLADTRPLGPQDQILNDETTAGVLSGHGDTDVADYQRANQTLSDLDKAGDTTLSRYQGAYGTIEGNQRYQELRSRLSGARRDALIPGIAGLRQAQTQRYIAGLPIEQQSEASDYLNFARGRTDIAGLIGPGGPSSLAALLGSGALSGRETSGFTSTFNATAESSEFAAHQAADQEVKDQQALAAAAAQGTAALDRERVAQDAYNKRFNESGGNVALATQARTDALRVRDAQSSISDLASFREASSAADRNFSVTSARSLGQSIGGATGASLERDAQTLSQYAEKIQELTSRNDTSGLQNLQALIDHIRELGNVSAQASSDAANLSAARTRQAQADVDRTVATAPASQRPFLRAAGQAYQSNLANPAISGTLNEPQIGDKDQLTITAEAQRQGVDPSLALLIGRLEGAGDPNGQNPFQVEPTTSDQIGYAPVVNRQDSIRQGVTYLARLGQDPTLRGDPLRIAGAYNRGPNYGPLKQFIKSGDTDLSGYDKPSAQYPHGDSVGRRYLEQAGSVSSFSGFLHSRDAPTQVDLQSITAQQAEALAAQEADASNSFNARQGVNPGVFGLLSQGRTGAAAVAGARYVDPTDPNGANDAARRVASVQSDQARAYATTTGEIKNQTDANNALAQAYTVGIAAVEAANEAAKVRTETLQGNLTAEQAAARAVQVHNEALSQQAVLFSQTQKETGDQISRANFNSSLGLTSDYNRAKQLNTYDAQQTAQQQFPNDASQQAAYVSSQSQLFDAKQQEQGVLQVNDSFKQLGDTIVDTFSRGEQGGISFKHLLGQLFESVGQIIENLTLMKPLEAALQSNFGSVLGTSVNGLGAGGSNNIFSNLFAFLGLGGGATAAGVTSIAQAASDPIALTLGFARGGTFMNGMPTRFNATGSVVNTPTAFQTADGGMNVMGEAGPEGIFPLTTLPNGSLGIASSGSGNGGPASLMVHAPITVQSNSGPGVPMDPQASAQLQKHFEMVINTAINNSLIKQGRPGGILYTAAQGGASN